MLLPPADQFPTLVVAELPRLRAYAMKLCKNHSRADDLVQETVAKALTNRHGFELGNLAAWLTTIMAREFFTAFRKTRREVEDPDEKYALGMVSEATPQRILETREALIMLQKLPKDFRIPLLLAADGATEEEIARELLVQCGTVKSRLNRGRAMLRAAIS